MKPVWWWPNEAVGGLQAVRVAEPRAEGFGVGKRKEDNSGDEQSSVDGQEVTFLHNSERSNVISSEMFVAGPVARWQPN